MNNADTRLSPHFHLSEFTASETAVRLGLPNDPSEVEIGRLRSLCNLLEAVRVTLGGKPIIITSGFRSRLVNLDVGGAKRSAHIDGRAADFICPGYGSPREICQRLSDAGLPFDKLINEGNWVHIQIQKDSEIPRRQVLTAVFSRDGVSYFSGLAQ